MIEKHCLKGADLVPFLGYGNNNKIQKDEFYTCTCLDFFPVQKYLNELNVFVWLCFLLELGCRPDLESKPQLLPTK
jgi:hypothetical protein